MGLILSTVFGAGARLAALSSVLGGSADTLGKKIVFIGDSITANGLGRATDTKNAYHREDGYTSVFMAMTGHAYYCPMGIDTSTTPDYPLGGNVGIGGDTTTDMLARYQDDVLAQNPDIISILGGTNDITSGDSYATITQNLDDMITDGLAAGAEVWIHTILPRNTDGAGLSDFTANQRLLRAAINDWIREQNSRANVVVIDHDILMTLHSSGSMNTGYTRDGLHLNAKGSYFVALGMVNCLNSRLPAPYVGLNMDAYNLYDATYNPYGNLVSNANLQGTSGTASTGVTGSVATDWIASRSSGSTVTAVASKITTTINGNTITGQRFVVTANGTGALDEIIRFRSGASGTTGATVITNGLSTNDWIEAGVLREFSGFSGSSIVQSVYNQITDTSASGATVRSMASTADCWILEVDRTEWLKSPPLQLTGTSGFYNDILLRIDGSRTGSVTIDLYCPHVKKLRTAPPFTY